MSHEEILTLLRNRLGDAAVIPSSFLDNQRVTVSVENLYAALECLKRDAGFDLLAELSAADYLHYPGAKDRYGLWYIVVNTTTGRRLTVKTWLNDPGPGDPGINYPDDDNPMDRLPLAPSVYLLWKGSDWMEREVYDMYGIVFEGHPDLRRILMPDEFMAFPLRKDYPMRGHGERHNFTVITRADS